MRLLLMGAAVTRLPLNFCANPSWRQPTRSGPRLTLQKFADTDIPACLPCVHRVAIPTPHIKSVIKSRYTGPFTACHSGVQISLRALLPAPAAASSRQNAGSAQASQYQNTERTGTQMSRGSTLARSARRIEPRGTIGFTVRSSLVENVVRTPVYSCAGIPAGGLCLRMQPIRRDPSRLVESCRS